MKIMENPRKNMQKFWQSQKMAYLCSANKLTGY